MNLQEFSALKEGDKIENPMSGVVSTGTVTEVTPSGVRLMWGDNGVRQYYYSVQSTAWTHWSKVEPVELGPDLVRENETEK